MLTFSRVALWISILSCCCFFSISADVTWSISSTGTVSASQLSAVSWLAYYNTVKSQFTTLQQDISTLSSTGNYWEMISLLQCMSIAVPTNDTTYLDLLQQLKTDFDRDFLTFTGVVTDAQLIRLNFYAQSLRSIKESLDKDRLSRQSTMQTLVSKNQALFNQLLSDKKLLDDLITNYNKWSQQMVYNKAIYWYTLNQYDTIVKQYTLSLTDAFHKNLTLLEAWYIKKNKDIMPLSSFSSQQVSYIKTMFNQDLKNYFNQYLWGLGSTDTVQTLQSAASSIQSSYYSGGVLQCGLLTSINNNQRTYYNSLVTLLKDNITKIQSTNVSWSTTSWSISTNLFASGSQGLQQLINWNQLTTQSYFTLYKKNISDQIALWKKVIGLERESLDTLNGWLIHYKEITGTEKSSLKDELVARVRLLEKNMISVRNTATLQRIKKSLGLDITIQPKVLIKRVIRRKQ
jgi:hypothetical protein